MLIILDIEVLLRCFDVKKDFERFCRNNKIFCEIQFVKIGLNLL